MTNNQQSAGRQSFNRGIRILEILAEGGASSASAIAAELGINQSSVSRLLQSLQQSGLVHKPSYHSFALDLGILRLAGIAMTSFPIVKEAVNVCNELHRKYAYGFSVATLEQGNLLYLAKIEENVDAGIEMVELGSFPISQSSMGRCLAAIQGKDAFSRLLKKEGCPPREIKTLWEESEATSTARAEVYLKGVGLNKSNAARVFDRDGRHYALAVFSQKKIISPSQSGICLTEGIQKLCPQKD
ncbi:helix-turn-helix domain-containing protein [Kiritimatiellaeota bacterium B1221]|nr:helix-turn-helix domain-containing protein [Kiritimatiellaeota bacterium B1221]